MRKGLTALGLFLVGVVALPAAQTAYYPPAGQWARKAPAEVGMDAARLNDAVEFMKSHETESPRRDFSDQEIVNGSLLASMPTERAGSNGVVIRRGYLVAAWGDTERPDPTKWIDDGLVLTSGTVLVNAKDAIGTTALSVVLSPSWNGTTADWSCTTTPAKYAPSSCRG